ncbi:MAG: YdcF family protein [Alphaproteobacteria bacterium]
MSFAAHPTIGRHLIRVGRILAVAILIVAVTWLIGLTRFVSNIPAQPPAATQTTDAIVVLTGGSGRLDAGLELLDAGHAQKLFVSGVYRGVDVAALLRLSQRNPNHMQCCIALGYIASNTRENALETADWMRQQGYRSLRLVTANYHMPRSLVEFQRQMPTVEIAQYPIVSENVDLSRWWRPATALLLLSEYNKYLIARALGWLPHTAPPPLAKSSPQVTGPS